MTLRKQRVQGDLTLVLHVLEHAQVFIYNQGSGSVTSLLLLAGLSPGMAFSVVKAIMKDPGMKIIYEKDQTATQTITTTVFELLKSRNISSPILRSGNLRMKIEACIMNWILTWFGTALGIPEILSLTLLLYLYGTKILICLCVVVLEKNLVEWAKSSKN